MKQLSLVQQLEERFGTVVCAGRSVSNQFLNFLHLPNTTAVAH